MAARPPRPRRQRPARVPTIRIPIVLAEVGIPETGGGARGSLQQAAAPYQALYAGTQELERTANNATLHLGRLEQQKRDLGIRIEAATLRSQYELQGATLLETLKRLETDPDAFERAWQEGTQKIHQDTLGQAKYEETKALLQLHLPAIQAHQSVAALKAKNDIFISKVEGDTDKGLAQLRILGAMTPSAVYNDPEAQARGVLSPYQQGVMLIENARAAFGNKKTEDHLIQWKQQYANDHANLSLRDNPFMDITPYQSVVSPSQFDKLTTRQDVLQRGYIALQDREDRKAKQRLDEANKYLVDEAESQALRGQLSLERLERMRESRIATGEDYRRLYKLVTEPKDTPDDAATADRLVMGSHGLNPTVTERQVRDARENGKLSLRTAASILDRLKASAETKRSQGESQLVRDHNQAEQVLRAALGIQYGVQGLVAAAMKDDPAGRLYFSGLDELSRRSALFRDSYGGTENPLVVVDELGQRLNKALMQSNNNRTQEIVGSLRYPTPQALEQARRAGQINESAYVLELRKFSEIDRLNPPTTTTPPKASGSGTPKSGERPRLEYGKPGG